MAQLNHENTFFIHYLHFIPADLFGGFDPGRGGYRLRTRSEAISTMGEIEAIAKAIGRSL